MRAVHLLCVAPLLLAACSDDGTTLDPFGNGTPAASSSTPTPGSTDPALECAPSIETDSTTFSLVYDSQKRPYVRLPFKYTLSCGQALGGSIVVALSGPTADNTFYYFVEAGNDLIELDLDAATVSIDVPAFQDPASTYTFSAVMFDSEGYPSAPLTGEFVPLDYDE